MIGNKPEQILLNIYKHAFIIVSYIGAIAFFNRIVIFLCYIGRIRNIKHRKFHTFCCKSIFTYIHPDTKQFSVSIWMQIFRKSRNLKLSKNLRIFRVGKVYREQWIYLPVSNEISCISHKSCRIDCFILCQIVDGTNDLQLVIQYIKRIGTRHRILHIFSNRLLSHLACI